MRLVLRVLDWYTSCSSLNLPSAEYRAMHAVGQPLVSWLFSHSLIDAGQRSEKSSHAALSSGITSPTSRSESSFGCVRLNSGASQEPERSPPSLPTLRKAGGGLPSGPQFVRAEYRYESSGRSRRRAAVACVAL